MRFAANCCGFHHKRRRIRGRNRIFFGLVERLLASLAGETDPGVERSHLNEIRERRTAVRSGKANLVDGAEVIQQVRAALRT